MYLYHQNAQAHITWPRKQNAKSLFDLHYTLARSLLLHSFLTCEHELTCAAQVGSPFAAAKL
jgi:hypothetical protein